MSILNKQRKLLINTKALKAKAPSRYIATEPLVNARNFTCYLPVSHLAPVSELLFPFSGPVLFVRPGSQLPA